MTDPFEYPSVIADLTEMLVGLGLAPTNRPIDPLKLLPDLLRELVRRRAESDPHARDRTMTVTVLATLLEREAVTMKAVDDAITAITSLTKNPPYRSSMLNTMQYLIGVHALESSVRNATSSP